MIIGALSNAAYRLSLHGPRAELEGFKHPQPSAVGAEHYADLTRVKYHKPQKKKYLTVAVFHIFFFTEIMTTSNNKYKRP